MIFSRNIAITAVISLLILTIGCGWSTPESKKNSMTGVSESGYPKGEPADSGSPAIGVAKRAEKEKKAAETK